MAARPNSKPALPDMAVLRDVLNHLSKRCPRLVRLCYWAGTSCIAMEELGHRRSFDLDFHTRRALQDVRPILAEIKKAYPDKLEVLNAPDEFGAGFRVSLKLPKGNALTIEVLSNFDDVDEADLEPAKTVRGMTRVSLLKYLSDKIQCLIERAEARDLVDIMATLRQRPKLEGKLRQLLRDHDVALMTERLMAWTDTSIRRDLGAYSDVDPRDAMEARDLILDWMKGRRS